MATRTDRPEYMAALGGPSMRSTGMPSCAGSRATSRAASAKARPLSSSAALTPSRFRQLSRPQSGPRTSGWMDELRELPRSTAPAPVHAIAASALPRLSHPLRVEPPAEYNAPQRISSLEPVGGGMRAKDRTLSRLAKRPLTGMPNIKVQPERMKDYAVLGAACRRAGRMANAAQLAFNRGVLYENMGEAAAALRCYKDLLRASLESGDAVAEALACNCIGVNLQLRGEALKAEPRGEALIRDAIGYHQQHLKIADVPGKFIANCNLGLAHQALGMEADAAAAHEQACLSRPCARPHHVLLWWWWWLGHPR